MNNDKMINNRLGQAKQSLAKKRYNDAIQQYQSILLTDANNVSALDGLARALIGTRRYIEASAVCERALAQDPNQAVFHYLLGYIYKHSERKEEAERELRQSLELDPSSVNAKLTLAALLMEGGFLRESNTIYREVLILDPTNEMATTGLGMNVARAGNRREGARLAWRAFWLKPSWRTLTGIVLASHEAYPWVFLLLITLCFLFLEVYAREYAAFCALPTALWLGLLAFSLYHLPRKIWAGVYLGIAIVMLSMYSLLK